MNNVFLELTLILIVAGGIAFLISFFKQPSLIAYILTGLIVGPLGYYQLQHKEILQALSEIGITLLLFMTGLDLDFSQLKRIGRPALYAGAGQILFTFLIGLGLIRLLGFSGLSAWYISIALTFSSTIVVVKLLNEKRDLHSLYGKLAVGIFLVQDFAAIVLLIFLSSATGGNFWTSLPLGQQVFVTLVKALLLGLLIYWHSKYLFPRLLRHISRSDELLLVFSLAWALGLAAFVSLPFIGFNITIGGFLAGIALANSSAHYQISARIKSLRDFFIMLFFIVLGSQLTLGNLAAVLLPAIILSAFVLIGNPVIIGIILSAMGYKPRTAFMAGVTVAQISEFSLVLMALGLSLGHVSETAVSLVTVVGLITIALSSYGILYSHEIYEMFKKPILMLFSFKLYNREEDHDLERKLERHIILMGAHRLGGRLIKALARRGDTFLVIDFNPDIVAGFAEEGIPVVYGDATDPEIQELAALSKAKLVISTIPDFHDNLILMTTAKRARRHTKLIVTAQDEVEARALYEMGANYVILPHFIGGQHLAKILEDDPGLSELKKLRAQHLKMLGV